MVAMEGLTVREQAALFAKREDHRRRSTAPRSRTSCTRGRALEWSSWCPCTRFNWVISGARVRGQLDHHVLVGTEPVRRAGCGRGRSTRPGRRRRAAAPRRDLRRSMRLRTTHWSDLAAALRRPRHRTCLSHRRRSCPAQIASRAARRKSGLSLRPSSSVSSKWSMATPPMVSIRAEWTLTPTLPRTPR